MRKGEEEEDLGEGRGGEAGLVGFAGISNLKG